ncbi:unnamed protein product [Clavelina lepadiformis]|uniref:Mo25-like protein n=1 Tax=Clavelina lepadiformis TaxID=159417 RepID=A0ABP0GEG0_CLALP
MMKSILCGSEQHQPQPELVAQISERTYRSDVMVDIVVNLSLVNLEGRNDFAQVFLALLKREAKGRLPTIEYLITTENIIVSLVEGYESPDIALFCGKLLRECIQYEPLANIIFEDNQFFKFFEYVEMSNSEIASDAFATFKDLLTRHRTVCSEFLSDNFDRVFQAYNRLLESENCLLRCQSLKLLAELFGQQAYITVMMSYVGKPENLQLIMNNLRAENLSLQFEAFNVFKFFVGNPNKTKPVLDIFLKNQENLVDFLSTFQNDRSDDEQFHYEKIFLIEQIKELSG